jgi:hypothetical protein
VGLGKAMSILAPTLWTAGSSGLDGGGSCGDDLKAGKA